MVIAIFHVLPNKMNGLNNILQSTPFCIICHSELLFSGESFLKVCFLLDCLPVSQSVLHEDDSHKASISLGNCQGEIITLINNG